MQQEPMGYSSPRSSEMLISMGCCNLYHDKENHDCRADATVSGFLSGRMTNHPAAVPARSASVGRRFNTEGPAGLHKGCTEDHRAFVRMKHKTSDGFFNM